MSQQVRTGEILMREAYSTGDYCFDAFSNWQWQEIMSPGLALELGLSESSGFEGFEGLSSFA